MEVPWINNTGSICLKSAELKISIVDGKGTKEAICTGAAVQIQRIP